ncbi:MAG: glycosyltransferase family 2 protein [Myxococcota bacterium]
MTADSGAYAASVLIATRDRSESLARTLASLAEQKLPRDAWELIIVDNGSRDATAQVLADWKGALPLRVLTEPRPGKSRALNAALPAARGALVAFTDDDVLVSPGWLADLLEASRRWPEASIFGGPIEPVFPDPTPAWIRSPDFVLASEAFGRWPAAAEGLGERLPYGANMALRDRLVARHRFDESIGPDGAASYAQGSEYELLRRLRDAGERAAHVPSAGVRHVILPHQIERAWLLARAERVGRGSARIKRKRVPRSALGWPPLLLRLLAATWRARHARRLADPARFELERRAHHWRGYVAESRRLRRERRAR